MDYRFDIIEWRRQQMEMSFDQLATAAEVSGDTALRACKGGNITTRTLRHIASALGLDGDRLLDRKLKRSQFPALVIPGTNGKPTARKKTAAPRVAQNTR